MFGLNKPEVVYIGADHAGYQAKTILKDFLTEEGYDVTDLGTFSEDAFDYPDIAREVAEKVVERKNGKGILICGTGIGMEMAANKLKGARAVNARDEEMAKLAREHNNANVLALGSRFLDNTQMQKIALIFLTTAFDETVERHVRRVKKIDGK